MLSQCSAIRIYGSGSDCDSRILPSTADSYLRLTSERCMANSLALQPHREIWRLLPAIAVTVGFGSDFLSVYQVVSKVEEVSTVWGLRVKGLISHYDSKFLPAIS